VTRAAARPIEQNAGLRQKRAGLVSIDDGPMRADDGLFSIEASAIKLTAAPCETIEGFARVDGGLRAIDSGLVKIGAGPFEIITGFVKIDAGLIEIIAGLVKIDAGLVEAPSRLAALSPSTPS
jgi:hypothetical protein